MNDDPDTDHRNSYDFETVREQLRYWPYTINQIEDTLDISLIEGRGRQLLFQAINSRNLTAFVGSGVASAYGRLSWPDWQKEQFSVVIAGADSFTRLVEASRPLVEALVALTHPVEEETVPEAYQATRKAYLKHHTQKERYNIWRWLLYRDKQIKDAAFRVEGLYKTFKRTSSNQGEKFPGGEELPLKFQIGQQLHDQLRHYVQIFMAPHGQDEEDRDTVKRCWTGSRIDAESAAPEASLAKFEKMLKDVEPEALTELRAAFDTALLAYIAIFKQNQTRVSAETLSKLLLFDERAHAMIMLRSGLLRGRERRGLSSEVQTQKYYALERQLRIFDQTLLRREIPGIRENPEIYRVLSAFRFDTLELLRKTARTGSQEMARWSRLINWEETRLDQYLKRVERAGDDRKFLTPNSRFLVGMYLCLIDEPFELLEAPSPKKAVEAEDMEEQPDPTERLPKDSQLLPELSRTDFRSRRSIIANRFDPLAKTVRQLGIKRYITMNYDLEIERYFQDIGYRKFPEIKDPSAQMLGKAREPLDDEFRSDATGGVLLDQTFRRETASELVAFSVGDQRKDAGVFHLHGRATNDAPLVVTERDYMNLYLLEDEYRDSVNEAITMAFSSSPLVFLGLGMSEADLLRPLRQFMSNRDRTIGYQAVAILPGEKPIEDRTKFSVMCFLRYGVHTIFYGSGQIPNMDGKEKSDLPIDWLCRILQLYWGIYDELKALKNGGTSKADDVLLRDLAKKVGFWTDSLSDNPEKRINLVALSALFGVVEIVPEDIQKDALEPSRFTELAHRFRKDKLRLRVCQFTPIRPDVIAKKSHHYDKKVFIDGEDYVGFATGMLNEALLVLMNLHRDAATPEADPRGFTALELTLKHLYGAFLTGALNAQLMGLEKEWRSWWKNWQQTPPHRLARFDHLPGKADPSHPFQPARFIRHRVSSVITDTKKMEEDFDPNAKPADGERFKTGVRAFDTFIDALHDRLTCQDLQPDQRFLATIAAYRGLGKGSFLSAVSSRMGMFVYEDVTWRRVGASGTAKPFLLASCFINFSFSTEIASCYDALRRALLEICTVLRMGQMDLEQGHDVARIKKCVETCLSPGKIGVARPYFPSAVSPKAQGEFETLQKEIVGVSRLQTLEHLFMKFRKLSRYFAEKAPTFGRPRLLVYLSGLELIYDADGRPKNGEIDRLLKLVFSKEGNSLPVDFVLVGSEKRLGTPFSQSDADRDFIQKELSRNGIEARGREQIEQRLLDGRIESVLLNTDPAGEVSGADEDTPINYVHFARPVSPVTLLNDNFQTLALGLYLIDPPYEIDTTKTDATPILEELKKVYSEAVQRGRKASDNAMDEHWMSPELPSIENLDRSRKAVWAEVRDACEPLLAKYARKALAGYRGPCSIEALLEQRLSDDSLPARQEWHLVRRRLGNNRFITTLLLAAGDFIIAHSDNAIDGAAEANKFILSTVDEVRSAGIARRDEIVLRIVLERYRRSSQIGIADLDIELHQLVLRHLGVIGAPTSSAVLVRLPEFRAYFRRIGIELDHSRRRFLSRALTVLAYRGLVFRIDPHPRLKALAEMPHIKDDPAWPAREDYRFALHRTVQKYTVSKMGVGNVDPIQKNAFAPRIYASMPSIGAGLSFESYQFLRSLLVALSQYPDIQREDTTLLPWLFDSKSISIKVQALRAALSLARSTFSVATLSRFPAYADRDETLKPRLGLLQNYKIRLRWIVRMAWELIDPSEIEKATNNPEGEFNQINPLYRDEIVWLYNELGVIALTQGNLSEALGFLRQAAEFNEGIEGRSRFGPVYDNIDLNHAIVQMERGRLKSAETRLERIKNGQEPGTVLRALAKGYLCVLANLRGEHAGLHEEFNTVVNQLQKLKDSRACAIFMAHRARFTASLPDKMPEHDLDLARAMAETGGHEDVRHHVELARLTLHVRATYQAGVSSKPMHNASALQQLRDIEMYGRRMGISSLQVDALRLRAQILLAEGETSTAGALLVRAMSMAKRNHMFLRLNGALTLYARLLLKRGDMKGAERHALISLEMAKEYGYSLQTSLAQRILAEIDPKTY